MTVSAAAPSQTSRKPPAPAYAKRVVSMMPSITEIVFALGAADRVVAVSDYCDYPPAVTSLPRVGSFVAPVTEAIVALEPDLVLTSPSPGNENAVRALQRSGIRVEVVYGDGSIAEVRAAIERIASILGLAGEGAVLLAGFDAELAAVEKSVAGLPRPRVAVVVGHDPLILAGPDSYLGELTDIAGGENIAALVGGRWPQVGWEFLIGAAPEAVIDVSMGAEASGAGASQLQHWARFPTLPAVAAGRIFTGERSLLLRPGPRLGRAGAALARMLHPETASVGARR